MPTVHNTREFDYGDADHPLRSRLRRAAYRQMLRRCAATVAVSEPFRLSLLRSWGVDAARVRRLFAVPTGCEIPPSLPRAPRSALLGRRGAS